MTVPEIDQEAARILPLKEQPPFASLILRDATENTPHESSISVLVDSSDHWTDDDRRDATLHSLRRADELYPEEEALV